MDTIPADEFAGMPSAPLEELTAFLHELADAAAEVTLPHFRSGLSVDDKSDGKPQDVFGYDPVTLADKAAEEAIRGLITARYPNHGIHGEEYGLEREQARYRWIIDPIDGTRAFVAGVPTWGTLIALYKDGKPLLGLMDQPFTGERFWGNGSCAFYRRDGVEQRLATRKCARLSEAVFSTTSPDFFEPGYETACFEALKAAVMMPRYGYDCYAYSLLAMGQIDIVAEGGLKPYDIAALIPIVTGAGGQVSLWDGGSAAHGGQILASGDARVHAEALQLFRSLSQTQTQ